MKDLELGIYIHIPFCVQKCYYCDFVSFANKKEIQEKYVNKLIQEIKDNEEILKNRNITTIYIGGGTPSSIESRLVENILKEIYKIANIDCEKTEITIELNPGTATKQKFEDYKKIGINRLSIGLQTTNNDLLKEIGRIHSYEQFLETYKIAQEVGYENINVDLMLGLPNQTIEILKDSLKRVVDLKPKHISVYSLIVEEGTPIEKRISSGKLVLPKEEEERNQYKYTKNFLEINGYKHYEISNFAKESYESKHNMNCWEQKQYIGFGLAAHSYIDGIRYSNTIDLEEYINNLSQEIKQIHEKQSIEDMQKEYMLLGLRKIEGIKISKFKEKYGENPIYLFRNELDKLSKQDLIEVDLDNIKLTEKGLDFANIVWEEFV